MINSLFQVSKDLINFFMKTTYLSLDSWAVSKSAFWLYWTQDCSFNGKYPLFWLKLLNKGAKWPPLDWKSNSPILLKSSISIKLAKTTWHFVFVFLVTGGCASTENYRKRATEVCVRPAAQCNSTQVTPLLLGSQHQVYNGNEIKVPQTNVKNKK